MAKQSKIKRYPGSVFVDVEAPESVQQQFQSKSYFRDWTAVGSEIGSETPTAQTPVAVAEPERVTPQGAAEEGVRGDSRKENDSAARENAPTPSPNGEDPTLTAEELLSDFLPRHIETTRWGRYIVPGPASRIFDGTIFIYHNPSHGFWDLYELGKGIFRDLGIKLSKPKGVWQARIPIKVLTDQVFVESGLAGVEKTLLAHTGIDPSEILAGIRQRQLEETKAGMAKVKQMREAVADAVGVLAITAVSWATYVVFGGAL
ncbi:MAG: hypothetical protein OXL96_14000 [Candidatus Poribacteria bacterium]|nr:hypothetical protein [Candidatus Poribacteria bacterium]